MITEHFIASQSWLSQSPWRNTFMKCHSINKEVIDCRHAWNTAQGPGKKKGQRTTAQRGGQPAVRPAWMKVGLSEPSRMTAMAKAVTMGQGSLAVIAMFPLQAWSRKLPLSL